MTRAEVLAEYLGKIASNMPDPLAPGTAADAWLGVLVRDKRLSGLHKYPPKFDAMAGPKLMIGRADDPTPAIVRAMMAADPEFAKQMEGAEG